MFLWKAQDSYLLPTASTERVTSVPRTLSFPCHTSWWLQQLVRHNTLVLHCGCSWVLSYMCLQMHDSASFWCHPDTSCTVLVCCPLKITIFGRHTSLGCIKAAGASSSHLCQLAALFILFLFVSHPDFISDVDHPLSTINCLRISFQKVTSLGTVTFLEVNIHVTQDGKHINFEEHNLYFKEDFYISEHQLQLTCNFSPQNLFTLGKASLYIGCVANNNPIKLQWFICLSAISKVPENQDNFWIFDPPVTVCWYWIQRSSITYAFWLFHEKSRGLYADGW